MSSTAVRGKFQWTVAVPVLAMVVLAATWANHEHLAALMLIGVLLVGAVLAAVHHAEVVAHRVGEPFGSLILAVAVTVIEVGADRDADDQRRRKDTSTSPATPCSPR